MIFHQMIRRGVGYRKERMEKNDKESKGILYRIRNQNWNSVWIKDLPMLYYLILDDESI
jgi:hypothetical protein